MTQQPEALRLADKYEVEGFVGEHRFAKDDWCRKAAVELRRLHAANVECMEWNEAARHEIESLRARVQELEAELVKEAARTASEKLRADQMSSQHAMQCNMRRELEAQLESIGAGGVEPLRRADHLRGVTKMVPQGWKLVPVEPTLAMIRAGRDTPLAGEADDDSPEDYRCVYRAMLAAAPQPPVARRPDGDTLRKIARETRTSASDPAMPEEYVQAGWLAAIAAYPLPPVDHLRDATEIAKRTAMTDKRKEIYASAEESKAALRSIPVTPAHLEVLRLIDERGLNEQGVSNARYTQEIFDICAQLLDQRDKLRTAILLTLEENRHLADGDDCTLIALKRAISLHQPGLTHDQTF